jgi:hypothetical protein
VLSLPQGVAIIRAFENFPIEVHGRLEPRCMVRALSDACIRRQIEAAPLSKLLKLVLVHTSGAERWHLSAQCGLHHIKQAPLPRLYQHHIPQTRTFTSLAATTTKRGSFGNQESWREGCRRRKRDHKMRLTWQRRIQGYGKGQQTAATRILQGKETQGRGR